MSEKAMVFTDLHLHAHKDRADRLQNCLEVLDWVFEEAAKRLCKHIFFLGDLFHDRSRIDVLNYLKTFERFRDHMVNRGNEFEFYLLVGNHDMYHKTSWGVTSVKPMISIPRVHVIDEPTRMVIGGRKIDWMPHAENPVVELKKMLQANGGGGDLLLGHMAVNGAILNMSYGTKADVIVEYDNEMVPVDASLFSDWGMTMLGHYHGAQTLTPTAEYVGSPLELSYGEAFQTKHIICLDLETMKKEYIRNTFSPRHLIVSASDVRNECYDLNNNFIRIATDNLSAQELIDLKRDIVKNNNVLSLDSKPKERKSDADQTVIDNVHSLLLNVQEMLERYMEQRGVPEGLEAAKLKSKGVQCLESPSK